MSEDDIQEQDEQVEDAVESAVEEPVLSDEEKEALLDGIQSGEVEVHATDGPRYAEVSEFVISPRAHIVSNSYPRLNLLNTQFATTMGKTAEKLLNVPVSIYPGAIETFDYGELLERQKGVAVIVDFVVPPLEGIALLYFDSGVVAQLVECFFGGSSEEPATQSEDFFTTGERAVVQKFSSELLSELGKAWEKLSPVEPQQKGLQLSSDLIEGIDQSTPVFCCTFDMTINDAERQFRIVWPAPTIKPLIPAFKDQKRDADPLQDAHWKSVISRKVTDTSVAISSEVGRTTMSLREVAELDVGDIIDIGNPRRTFIFARDVPVLEGLFGMHNGHYAIEATRWLTADADSN